MKKVITKLLKFHRQNHAVSEVVSIILVIGVVISSMSTIVFWGIPLIEEKKMQSELQTVAYSFEMLDSSIKSMLLEGNSAKRIVCFMCPNDQGSLVMNSYIDKFIIIYSYDDAYNFSVTNLTDGNYKEFNISYRPGSNTFKKANITFLKPDGNYDPLINTSGDFIQPLDYDVKEENIAIGTNNDITASKELKGDLLIDLFNETGNLSGRVWVFDLGSVTYNAHYSPGTQKTVYQNGAIFSSGFNNKGVLNDPSFITTQDGTNLPTIALRIIQINASSGAGGRSTPRLGLDLKSSIKREEPIVDNSNYSNVSNLKFQFHGENEQNWIDYFTKRNDFISHTDSNTVYCSKSNISFILDSSFIEINIG